MEHFAFPGNIDFAADDQHLFDVLFMKGSCGYSSMKQCLQSVNGEQFLIEMTGQRAQQVEILDFNGNSSGERRLKFIASGEDDDNKKPRAKHREHRLANKHVQRQRQNTTITLQMEPMKRENTDCRRFKKRWGDQATLTVYSKITFFDTTIGSNSYTDDLYNLHQGYLSNGLRTAYQPLHHEQQ